ncbi:MAG: sterol carrier family protein [Actinomycetaceae bacterium]|nr:sterol carrier family protein [Actinomycetaceae bacterium]
MPRRRISDHDGATALAKWRELGRDTARADLLTATRWTLEEIAALHPGRSVEIRVPPAGAVQILPGTTHRRGTPPAVIETDAHTWLALATGEVTWEEATNSGAVDASGERTDLSPYLPFM